MGIERENEEEKDQKKVNLEYNRMESIPFGNTPFSKH